MSKFNSYAKKVDEIAKNAFEEYRKAEAAYKKAEEQARKYPQRYGLVDAQYAAQSARAQADLLEAKSNMDTAKKAFEGHKSEIAALRKQLVSELDDHYAANPAALDNNTLELLKSGILKPNEYTKLISKAQSDGNYTMARMIGKYALEAAAKRSKEYGDDDQKAKELRLISFNADQDNGNDTLQAFDFLSDVYNRSVNNPSMIYAWDELTSAVVENF